MTREQFDQAFIAAIDRQSEMVTHTPEWKPLIDLVWDEIAEKFIAPIAANAARYQWVRRHLSETMEREQSIGMTPEEVDAYVDELRSPQENGTQK